MMITLSGINFDFVGCFEDLLCFCDISAISRLWNRRYPISEIVVARPGMEPQTSSASKELNHYTTTAPINLTNFDTIIKATAGDKCSFIQSCWSKLQSPFSAHYNCSLFETVCMLLLFWCFKSYIFPYILCILGGGGSSACKPSNWQNFKVQLYIIIIN